MDRRAILLTLAIAAIATGCTLDHGQVYTNDAWPEDRERLGRVAVLPVRCLDFASEKSSEKITQLTEAAFRKLPEAEVVAAESLVSELARADTNMPISDYDLVMAARKLDIDTVCSLTVPSYTYNFMIGFALIVPVWDSFIRIEYNMRLLDVSTGKLLLETSRNRTKHLAYAGKWRRDLDDEFSKDLEWVLAARPPNEAEVATP